MLPLPESGECSREPEFGCRHIWLHVLVWSHANIHWPLTGLQWIGWQEFMGCYQFNLGSRHCTGTAVSGGGFRLSSASRAHAALGLAPDSMNLSAWGLSPRVIFTIQGAQTPSTWSLFDCKVKVFVETGVLTIDTPPSRRRVAYPE